MQENPNSYDSPDAELERENRALEEDLRLLGEPITMQPASDPKLHNQFLKQILSFHGMERGPQIPMRSLFPDDYEFPSVDSLSDAELEAKLDDILRTLFEHRIEVGYVDKLPDRLFYKHLVEEDIPEWNIAAENPAGRCLILDGCTGWCPDCFQKDFCDAARENWPEMFGEETQDEKKKETNSDQ